VPVQNIANNPPVRRSRAAKARGVDTIEALVRDARLVVVLQYRGINGPKASQVRRTVEGLGGRYHVVKGTLARIALSRQRLAALANHVIGPSALLVGDKPDRLLLGFRDFLGSAFLTPLHRRVSPDGVQGRGSSPFDRKHHRPGGFELEIRAAAIDHHVLSAAELAIVFARGGLAGLRAQLLAALQAPARFLGLLDAPALAIAALLRSRASAPAAGPPDRTTNRRRP
jgi:ribosomal protein L10